MKKFNKFLSLMLVLAMVLSMAACGGSEAPATEPAATQAPVAAETEAAAAVYVDPYADLREDYDALSEAIYKVGYGHLTHDNSGFHLTGCDGKLDYTQPPQAGFGLYADYYWYEIGDVICIGDTETHYFLFPQSGEPVAKIRLAAEEMYKLFKAKKLSPTK